MGRARPHPRPAGLPLSVDGEGARGEVRVELFGIARLATGRRQVTLELAGEATLRDVIAALARTRPELVGWIIKPDCSRLVDGCVLNINGLSFTKGLAEKVVSGDSVLVLSDQAGG